jgi:hypothetical protein
MHPGGKCRFVVKRADTPEESEKYLLRQIFRLVGVPQDAKENVVHAFAVRIVEPFKRRIATGTERFIGDNDQN